VRDALSAGSAKKIFFNLDGIEDPVRWAKTAHLGNPYASDLAAWELAMIKAAPKEVQARARWINGINPFK